MEQFLLQYRTQFTGRSKEELATLFQIANWMNIYFQYVPAKKNKGLCMQVIPKLIEGWSTHYITGSGQTIATRDRVHIYETEGNVHPFHRGKKRNSSKESNMEPLITKALTSPSLKTKRRRNACADINGLVDNTDSEISSVDFSRQGSHLTSKSSWKLSRTKTNSNEESFNYDNTSYDQESIKRLDSCELFTFSLPSFSRTFSWGVDLVGADSYLSRQEKESNGMQAFPNMHSSYNSAGSMLFPCELIAAPLLEAEGDQAIIF